jgi:hypothetical protein
MDNRREALNKALDPAWQRVEIPHTPIAALESALSGRNYFGGIDITALRGTAQRLNWDAESHWKPDKAVPRLFVRHLFSLPMRRQLDAIRELGGNLSITQGTETFDWLAPFWIHEQAAARFARITSTDPGHRGALINAEYGDFTPEMFARRARPHLRWDPKSFSIQQHVPVGRRGGIVEQVRSSILSRLDLEEDASQADISAELKYRTEDETLCSVIVDADDEILRQIATLQAELKEVLFVVLTDDHPISVPDELRDRFEAILPALGTGTDPRYDEHRALRDFNRCMERLGRPKRGETSHEQ